MNSRPVFSALAGVYGLEQIPANMIQRAIAICAGWSSWSPPRRNSWVPWYSTVMRESGVVLVSAGAQWNHSFKRLWFMPSELVAGLEYNHNYLHDVTVGYDHDIAQRVNIYSAYAQNEWRAEPLMLLLLSCFRSGARTVTTRSPPTIAMWKSSSYACGERKPVEYMR